MASSPGSSGAPVHSAVATKIVSARTILGTPLELYSRCRDLLQLSLILGNATQVTEVSPSSFKVTSRDYSWRISCELIADKAGEVIGWKSLPDSDLAHACAVRFAAAPGDEGTEVTVIFEYEPPGGKLGAAWSRMMNSGPGPQIAQSLRRLKALVEAGEIPTIEGQPVGEPQKSKREKST